MENSREIPGIDGLLARFHSQDRISLRGLQGFLLRAASKRAEFRIRLEQGRARWLEVVRHSLEEAVSEVPTNPVRLGRNLLATAHGETLPFWRHAMEGGALAPLGGASVLERALEAAEARVEPRDERCVRALAALARARDATALELMPIAEGSWPITLPLIESMPDTEARESLSALLTGDLFAGYDGNRNPSKATFRRVASAVEALLARRPRLMFGIRAFEALPTKLSDQFKSVDAVVSPAALAKRRRSQARTARKAEEAKAVIARESAVLSQAIDALFAAATSGGTQDWAPIANSMRPIGMSAKGRQAETLRQRFHAQFETRAEQWHLLAAAPEPVQQAIGRAKFGQAAALAAFLALPREAQMDLGAAKVRSHIGGSRQRSPRQLLLEFVALAVDRYLKAGRHESAVRARLWADWGPSAQPEARDAWNPVFSAARELCDDEFHHLASWLRTAPPEDSVGFVRHQSRWLDRNVADTDFVAEALGLWDSSITALLLCGGDVRRLEIAWKTLQSSAFRRNRPLYPFRHVLAAKNLLDAAGGTIADLVACEGPMTLGVELTLDLLEGNLDASRAALVIAQTMARDDGAATLERLAGGNGGALARTPFDSALGLFLAGKGKLDRALAEAIWRGKLTRGWREALHLCEVRPEAFADFAVRDVAAADLIAFLLDHGRAIDAFHRRMDLKTRHGALGRLRTQFSDEPTKLAVAELAVFAGLREIPLLFALAREAKRQPDAAPGTCFDSRYRTYSIPKRSGGTRTITAPEDGLKHLQRMLLEGAFDPVSLHDAAHGFRRGRSILTNANAHVGRELVVNVDIKGFFPSTLHEAVLSACFKVDEGAISAPAALLLADICCFDGALPTGAPTSPAIGNIVLRRADRAIATVAARYGISYTRYADDLTFSGDGSTKRILPFVRKVLSDCGYELDDKKTQLYRKGRQQLVTNLVVNDRANLRRSDRRRLRAAIDHRCRGAEVTWRGRPIDDSELAGRLALLAMIDRERADEHRTRLKAEAAAWGAGHD
jgi:retron-type reverse transcriptase